MLDAFVLQIVKWFVERQMLKWGKALDWTLVKKDLEERVKSLVPGTQFDDTAAYVAGVLIDIIAGYFKDTNTPTDAPQAQQILQQAFQVAQGTVLRQVAQLALSKR
jgi:hypothetical protein